MKKILLAFIPVLLLTACENMKTAGGNEMITGTRQFNYAYVKSQITGNKYYNISGWKEYEPEGGTETIMPYVGLELQLAKSGNVIYYYEPGLMYVMSQQYDSSLGKAID